jgi:hypothetical protein
VKKVTAIVKTGVLFQVVPINPYFITCDDVTHEMWLHFYPLFDFLTNFEALRLLIIAQQSWHKLSGDAPHGKIFS